MNYMNTNNKLGTPGYVQHYPVVTNFGGRPLFTLERAAVPFFGTKVLFVPPHHFLHLETGCRVLLTEKSISRFHLQSV